MFELLIKHISFHLISFVNPILFTFLPLRNCRNLPRICLQFNSFRINYDWTFLPLIIPLLSYHFTLQNVAIASGLLCELTKPLLLPSGLQQNNSNQNMQHQSYCTINYCSSTNNNENKSILDSKVNIEFKLTSL